MKAFPKTNALSVLLPCLLVLGMTIPPASAEPMQAPTKMPVAKAESVDMSSEGLSRIDEVMQEHIDAGNIQGSVTIVARRGKVVHFSALGEMNVEKGRAMESDAIFRMASSTKPVLGVAAMMMIEAGLMSPSDPVSKYIPEFADVKVAVLAEPVDGKAKANPGTKSKEPGKGKGKSKGGIPKHSLVAVEKPMTIHHLLTHTSGLRSGGLGSIVDPVKPRSKDDTLATYIPQLAKVPLDFQPGTQWAYSARDGLDVVARIIEIVSDTPFDMFLQERIFEPLAMDNTYFNLPSDMESERVVIRGMDMKSKGWGGKTKYFSASGGLSSAGEDYLHFEQMLLNGGELFGNRVISPESVRTMSSNQVGDLYETSVKKSPAGVGFGYTVGVSLKDDVPGYYRGKGAFGWGGAFGTTSWTDPKNELVAVLMLQQPHKDVGGDFQKAVRDAIIK